MRVLMGVVLSITVLAATGCSLHPPQPQGQTQNNKVSFDDLVNTNKMVMTTKMGSDLPNSWEYDDAQAKEKAGKLVPVLKQGTPIAASDVTDAKKVPAVTFEISVGGSMKVINVYDTSFMIDGNWYKLDQAPEKTYGSVEKLEDKKQ
ncbi:MAG: hypothetical protein ACXVDB_02115 [Tumebacillaceae bacterium]